MRACLGSTVLAHQPGEFPKTHSTNLLNEGMRNAVIFYSMLILTVAGQNGWRPPDHLVRLVVPHALRELRLQKVLRRPIQVRII